MKILVGQWVELQPSLVISMLVDCGQHTEQHLHKGGGGADPVERAQAVEDQGLISRAGKPYNLCLTNSIYTGVRFGAQGRGVHVGQYDGGAEQAHGVVESQHYGAHGPDRVVQQVDQGQEEGHRGGQQDQDQGVVGVRKLSSTSRKKVSAKRRRIPEIEPGLVQAKISSYLSKFPSLNGISSENNVKSNPSRGVQIPNQKRKVKHGPDDWISQAKRWKP